MKYSDYKACHKNDIFVELTDPEYEEAVVFGKQLYQYSQDQEKNGRMKDRRTFVRNGVDGERVQILGAIAEMAVAKALGIPWLKGVNTFKRPDLPHNIEVRLIGVSNYGLRISPRDKDTRRVVGIEIEKGAERLPYRIPGWINAKYGKKAEYNMDPLGRGQPMFAVPQEKLFHLDKLKELIEQEAHSWE